MVESFQMSSHCHPTLIEMSDFPFPFHSAISSGSCDPLQRSLGMQCLNASMLLFHVHRVCLSSVHLMNTAHRKNNHDLVSEPVTLVLMSKLNWAAIVIFSHGNYSINVSVRRAVFSFILLFCSWLTIKCKLKSLTLNCSQVQVCNVTSESDASQTKNVEKAPGLSAWSFLVWRFQECADIIGQELLIHLHLRKSSCVTGLGMDKLCLAATIS